MDNKRFKIGNLEINGKVILAPMAGYSSFSYRKFMKQFGPALEYTEMISDCGLLYDNQKTISYLRTDGSDRPLALQLFGGKTEDLLNAIDVLEKLGVQYDVLDLNLACPVPKVIRNNGGSSWLKDQHALYEMVSSVVKKSKKPVSCKIRLGFSEVNVNETVRTLEKAGCSFIAIHARTKAQGYTGKPNFDALKDIYKIIKIPFCISGDIYTVNDAINALNCTHADGVMVARGGVGNPKLIENINLALEGKQYNEICDFDEQTKYLIEYMDLLIDEYGEIKTISLLRGIAPKFYINVEGTKALRVALSQTIKSRNDILDLIDKFKKRQL